MFRFLSNMLFIVILFLLVTAMPLSKDILTINIFQPVIEKPTEVVPVETTFALEGHFSSIDYTPDEIEFSIVSTPHDFSETLYDAIEVCVYDGEQLISTTSLKDLSPTLVNSNENTDQISFSLKSITDVLKANHYRVEIKGTSEGPFNETLTLVISNEKFDKLSLEAIDEAPDGKLAMRLYYPTDAYELLVPISRIVDYPKNRSRTTLKELDKGPTVGLGLPVGDSIWPYASKLSVRSGNASVYVYNPEYIAFENDFKPAVDAITYTLTSLDFIDQTNFYIDNTKRKSYGGVNLEQNFIPRTDNLAYLNYNKDSNYMLLAPVFIELLTEDDEALSSDVLENAKTLWKVLSSPHFSASLEKSSLYLSGSIPTGTELKAVNFDAGKLTLGVDNSFNNAFSGHEAYVKQMLLSIAKSFNSLEGVDEVYFTINGESPTDFYGYDLSKPLTNPAFINLEP
ncbi:GerMN domain-containing protein [Fusibacter ferrireducens]|uniref:GerMN domain-containing protein n=1 Tax=Fusibacter ferrireducens TaxID=2785058 RepID=A0ABR9ZY87_9FIRM|nr:GerMN domain-containing protein [Fusibacter ferrireducens]MBF4695417.1 GerMN domain-containing protein [Fusibacter ferrireducens]